MKIIALCTNPYRDRGLARTLAVQTRFESGGVGTVVCPIVEAELDGHMPQDVELRQLEDVLDAADMLVTFGGDGTILRTARLACAGSAPILGVNLGTKGFMTELDTDDPEVIFAAATGGFSIDSRMMVDLSVERGGRVVYRDYALNDVVAAGLARMIALTVLGDGRRITGFSGDGIILSTPTGSTAYSMSAGGPIVEPSAENIIVTPICAHSLVAKSFVLAPDRRVTVEVDLLKGKDAYLSVDGANSFALETGDRINVWKSAHRTRLVRVRDRNFYEIVSQKLGER